MTLAQAPNVTAQTGSKQLGQCVAAERGQPITMCSRVNAIGNKHSTTEKVINRNKSKTKKLIVGERQLRTPI